MGRQDSPPRLFNAECWGLNSWPVVRHSTGDTTFNLRFTSVRENLERCAGRLYKMFKKWLLYREMFSRLNPSWFLGRTFLNRAWTMFKLGTHQRTASGRQTNVRATPGSEPQAPLYVVGTTDGGMQVDEAALVHSTLPIRFRFEKFWEKCPSYSEQTRDKWQNHEQRQSQVHNSTRR